MNTRLPDADGTHRLGGLDSPRTLKAGETLTFVSSAVPTFTWPCDKRRAHGAHYRQPGGDQPPGDLATYLARKDPRVCPGVKAHPKTMIGGKLL